MSVIFQYPEGLLWAVLAVPLLMFLFFSARHEWDVWRELRWPPTFRFVLVETALGTAAFLFLALTLARPMALSVHAERFGLPSCSNVLFVFDIGKSMAAGEPHEPHRLDRARTMAQEIVDRFEGRIGIAALSNLLSLHLYPTLDRLVLKTALEEVVLISSTPFSSSGGSTTLLPVGDALPALPIEDDSQESGSGTDNPDAQKEQRGFFLEDACAKVLVLFSDGDTGDSQEALARVAEHIKKTGVRFLAVGVGREGELIPQYDENGQFIKFDTHVIHFNESTLLAFADAAGGLYLSEKESEKLFDAVGRFAQSGGGGEPEVTETRRVARDLTPAVGVATFVFSGLLLAARFGHILARRM